MKFNSDVPYDNDSMTLGDLIARLQKIDPKTNVKLMCDHRVYPVKVGLERGVLHEMHIDMDFNYVTEFVNMQNKGEK